MKSLRRFALALALLLAAGVASAEIQKRTLLAMDGTLYQVQTGLVSELGAGGLGPAGPPTSPSSGARSGRTGRRRAASSPAPSNSMPKTSLDLTVDEATGTLVVLWREENFVLNKIRLAIARSGSWTLANLLPNAGFPHAYNPQMLLTHQTVHWLDEDDVDVYANRSVLSVIWWEEASQSQARYASHLPRRDDRPVAGRRSTTCPSWSTTSGRRSLEDIPTGAYAFPSLQSEGPGGEVLASFAALSSKKQYVVRVSYPTELGKPSIDNITWQRRRIPVVGIASEAPIAAIPTFGAASVSTVVGSSYRPTLHWRDDVALHYVRFDGTAWSAVRSIAFSDEMTYDKAVALVEGMAQRN